MKVSYILPLSKSQTCSTDEMLVVFSLIKMKSSSLVIRIQHTHIQDEQRHQAKHCFYGLLSEQKICDFDPWDLDLFVLDLSDSQSLRESLSDMKEHHHGLKSGTCDDMHLHTLHIDGLTPRREINKTSYTFCHNYYKKQSGKREKCSNVHRPVL